MNETRTAAVLAVSVALVRDGRILLVRRGRAPAKGLYAFPGGRVEPGEALVDAARRELREETGLRAHHLTPLRSIAIPAEGPGHRYDLTVFAAQAADGELMAADDADHADFYTLEEMDGLPLTDSTREIAVELFALGGGGSAR